eukprot:gene2287-2597_t
MTATLEQLPAACLSRILMFLPEDDGAYRLSLVSKSIYEVISASSRRLCVPVDALDDSTAGKLVRRNLKPIRLLLASEKRVTPHVSPLAQLFSCCWTQLRLLRVRNFTVPFELLQLFPKACPQLQELFLEEVSVASSMAPDHLKPPGIVHQQLQQVAAALSQLQHLQLLRMDWEFAEPVMDGAQLRHSSSLIVKSVSTGCRPRHICAALTAEKAAMDIKKKTAAGILLPKGPPKSNSDAHFGEVLAIGSGVTLKLSVGDKVVFNKYAMAEVEVPDGDILFVAEKSILGKLE